MNALDQAIERADAFSKSAHVRALSQKAVGGFDLSTGTNASPATYSLYSNYNRQQRNYQQFRGWLYAAVHALSLEAAGQPIQIAKISGSISPDDPKSSPRMLKNHVVNKMPQGLQTKAASNEMEVLLDHPLIDALAQPNPAQDLWQLAYTFVANLNLTGWAYLVGGYTQDGDLEIYSLPSTWVQPDHRNGPFSQFRVGDPTDPNTQNSPLLGAEFVKVSRMPNPAHPLGAYAPATSQSAAIRIDDHIQTSQEAFFENGIFPGLVLTVGKDPHPEVPGGLRPRLSNAQRRQVISSVKKAMGGVTNYGEPAIIDGLIENIERLSATSNEMGWEKSEEKARTRILSAFGVHPYILGEPVSVGGSKQVADIHVRFCKRVNTFLELLSSAVTKIINQGEETEKLAVWWETCEYPDPTLYWQNMRSARAQGDISKNEFRAEMGFPPDENDVGPRSKILDNPNGMMAVANLLQMVSNGSIGEEAAVLMLMKFLQITEEEATEIVADSMGRQVEMVAQGNQVPSDAIDFDDIVEGDTEDAAD